MKKSSKQTKKQAKNAESEKILLKALSDIEEQKSLLDKQAKELKKFQLAVDFASEHIIITDSDGYILYANKAAEEITGYPLDEIVGNRPSLWGNQMPKSFYVNLWKTIKTDKKPFFGEVNNRRKNGESYVADVRISPALDEKGNPIFFVGIERDITKERQIDRAKSEFIAMAAHQLRTPLSAIKWTIELILEDQNLAGKGKERLMNLYKSNQRLIGLVNDLLSVSKIETGKTILNKKIANIYDIISESIKFLKAEADKKNQQIIVNVKTSLKELYFDPVLFAMAFNNTLSNAIHYGFPGTDINITLNLENENYEVAIKDKGLVIPESARGQIFTKFYRSSEAQAEKPEGSGLGLFIIKSVIEMQGGRVRYESSREEGTTFYLSIPLK